ncbi:hypothetical protein PENSTE_c024G00002 [Penicillium steckii]|uniref:Uncharacterized protein n=1 Tax=Penicillium steckii TaxID=303698 RepID=A0A1V6SQS4_9EURO|nr:hypothetical protein PENSTE_c024G00002 [Penicillium steckii]
MGDDPLSSQSLMNNEDRQSSPGNTKTNPPVPLDTLKRTPFILILALLYTTITLFSWTVLCTLTNRPFGTRSYNTDLHSVDGLDDYEKGTRSFGQNERILRAARFCQSLASVLTIPLTSMSMALADKGWNDPVLITKLITGGWKRYGSIFLICALVLNLIGASISPLQGLFVSYKSIKIPTEKSSSSLIDLQTWIDFAADPYNNRWSIPEQTAKLRSRLISTVNTDPQYRLWSRGTGYNISTDGLSQACAESRQSTFGKMPNISDPFWAQPPSGFQTGLWQQFAPRINFTTEHKKIPTDEFPDDCKTKPGALYMHYANMTDRGGYIVDICMPANQSQSPWKATRERQDFSEELYVKMTVDWKWNENPSYAHLKSFVPGNYSFKITLSTTAGYFELPNYRNGHLPGPLLDSFADGAEQDCGAQCSYQTLPFHGSILERRSSNETSKIDTVKALQDIHELTESVLSIGPLLSIVLVLFTERSYLDISHTIAATYLELGETLQTYGAGCADTLPIIKLLHEEDKKPVSMHLDPCVSIGEYYHEGPQKLGADYIWLFAGEAKSFNYVDYDRHSPSPRQIENAFTAAAFLAVDVWMEQSKLWSPYSTSGSLNWDMGVDQQIPNISHAGKVLISLLLGTYIFCILGLSLYITWTPRWTNQLDSFAMMRIGSSQLGQFPLRLAHNPDNVKALDKLPGWIGSTQGGKIDKTEYMYSLDLGGEESLQGRRRYCSYATEEDK